MATSKPSEHPAVAAVMAPLEGDRAALLKQGADIEALVAQFKRIESSTQYEEACSLRARAAEFVKGVEAKISGTDKAPGPKKLLFAAYKALGALETELSAPGVRVVEGLKRPILEYQDRQERARRDEEERLRAEAAKIAADAAELDAMMAAEDSPAPIAPETIESVKTVAAATASAAITLPKSAFVPAVEGQIRSENWVAEISDVDALLRQLLDPSRPSIDHDDPAVKGWRARAVEALLPLANMKARELKASGNGRFDGVRFYDDPKLSQRSGGRG